MSLHYTQQIGPRPNTFVVRCKLCHRNVPAAVETFPFNRNIVVACPLCGERRRYRPSEVFLGWVNGLVEKQKGSSRLHSFVQKPRRRAPDQWEP
jgi:RNase P subunit RPR2